MVKADGPAHQGCSWHLKGDILDDLVCVRVCAHVLISCRCTCCNAKGGGVTRWGGERTLRRIHKVGGRVGRKASGSVINRKSRTLPYQSRVGLLLSYKWN